LGGLFIGRVLLASQPAYAGIKLEFKPDGLGNSVVRRRRFKKPSDLVARLKAEASHLRKQAQGMPAGVRRDELMQKARQAETTARVTEWATSPGLQPPK
jgi:hypothetical protein